MITRIPVPERIAPILDALHDQFGKPDIQSVRGGTQVSLSNCPYTAVHRLVAQFPARVRGIWSVRLGEGGYHVPHNHPDGRMSGVYYVRTTEGGDLRLGEETLTPEEGLLVIFDSKIPHETTPVRAGSRLTIAFDA